MIFGKHSNQRTNQPHKVRLVINNQEGRYLDPDSFLAAGDKLAGVPNPDNQRRVQQAVADLEQRRQVSSPTSPHRPAGGWQQSSPLLLAATGSILVIVAYLLISLAVGFLSSRLDNLGYLCDQACTTHVEAFVGHESSGLPSHFVAINLHGQITVVEFPGSDPSKAMTITGPYLFGKGEDKVPVQLETLDLNGDGKSDLVISAKGAQTVYLNDGTAFRAMKPEERASIEQALKPTSTANGGATR